jgi:hypothetical protein
LNEVKAVSMAKQPSVEQPEARERSGETPTRHYPSSALVTRRSRRPVTSSLLMLLGLWGAIIPFIGPYFSYAFGVANPWFFTLDRLWLNVLPGIAVLIGGLILGSSTNRINTWLGAWLALIGGIWFTIGPVISQLWRVGGFSVAIGEPLGSNSMQVLEQLGCFFGLGVLITALAAFALGRFSKDCTR